MSSAAALCQQHCLICNRCISQPAREPAATRAGSSDQSSHSRLLPLRHHEQGLSALAGFCPVANRGGGAFRSALRHRRGQHRPAEQPPPPHISPVTQGQALASANDRLSRDGITLSQLAGIENMTRSPKLSGVLGEAGMLERASDLRHPPPKSPPGHLHNYRCVPSPGRLGEARWVLRGASPCALLIRHTHRGSAACRLFRTASSPFPHSPRP